MNCNIHLSNKISKTTLTQNSWLIQIEVGMEVLQTNNGRGDQPLKVLR